MSSKTKIEVYSDVVCPWCYIGATRLDHVTAALGEDVTVEYKTFLLRPDADEAGIDIAAMIKQKYGADPKPMFARVESAAKESGLALDLSRQPRSYPTIKAHTLIRHAAELGTQRALTKALFAAHFDDAQNIADNAVLVEIATQHGFSAVQASSLINDQHELDKTRMAALAASRQGITGVPFFIVNGKIAVSGAQSEDVLRQAIAEAQSQ